MKYTILSVSQVEDTIYTDVLYEFDDGSQAKASVPHFQPLTAQDVLDSIQNRFATEDNKAQATKRCASIVDELNQIKPSDVAAPVK